MNTKDNIFKYIEKNQYATGRQLSEYLGISRQAVNKHLKELIQNDRIIKEGVTRGTVYRIPSADKNVRFKKRIEKSYALSGLEEDKVFHELTPLLNLKYELSDRAFKIVRYAFTEMLNNAIDHSESEKCVIEWFMDSYKISFRIRDFGIGLFYSIFTKFNLDDENAAVGELLKGKTTTMAEKHTGEGIFFTSKASDVIFFRSHKIKLSFDNQKKDVFVEEMKSIKGTEVSFSISKRSKRRLDEIFSQFAPEEFDYRFDRTKALVKLFHQDYVSRSEAKRLLYGLDKFKEIILDFKGVKSIGQGFADEIFRVFKKAYPDKVIKIENLNPSLKPIIDHVVDNKIK
jgi:biotin operon repressor/anti-sigma regulatory factor (Ser/Thr protein kinase)